MDRGSLKAPRMTSQEAMQTQTMETSIYCDRNFKKEAVKQLSGIQIKEGERTSASAKHIF